MRTLIAILLFAVVIRADLPTNPPVIVTLRLEQGTVASGAETTLRAFARIASSHTNSADQIFSWNLDLVVVDRDNASLDPSRLARPTSDRDPATSSPGTPDGPDLRGIRDTFLNLPAAGRAGDVELFSIPVIGMAPGTARFRLLSGASGGLFDADFLVVPSDDGPVRTGADYTGAIATLTISEALAGPRLRISPLPQQRVRIEFDLPAGGPGILESQDALGGASWESVAGGTTANGTFSVELAAAGRARFYRWRQ